MDTRKILSDLHAERDRIDRAIAALQDLDKVGGGRTGAVGRPRRRRRHMSAATRRRMSEIMKQRWAERKRRTKNQ